VNPALLSEWVGGAWFGSSSSASTTAAFKRGSPPHLPSFADQVRISLCVCVCV
jgi:hypothetical protein